MNTTQRITRHALTLLFLTFIAGGLALLHRPAESVSHVTNELDGLRPASITDRAPKTQAIEDVRLGQRVLGLNPLRHEVDRVEPDPATWSRVRFHATKANGLPLDFELLRPNAWLEKVGARPGAQIELNIDELGFSGVARVIEVDRCPEISRGSGTCVTGRFVHRIGPDEPIYRLEFIEEQDEVYVTGTHRFWSENRKRFVEVEEIQDGEILRTLSGLVSARATKVDLGVDTVYNLETSEHVYSVGLSGILTHNGCQRGGRYRDVRKANKYGEVHHMPAASVSEYTHGTSPAIWMTKADHKQTASWGSSKAAKEYREEQAKLIAAGKFREAVEMDVDNIRELFPDGRYDDAIREMYEELDYILGPSPI